MDRSLGKGENHQGKKERCVTTWVAAGGTTWYPFWWVKSTWAPTEVAQDNYKRNGNNS